MTVELIYFGVLVASAALGLAFVRLLKGRMLSFGIGGADINKPGKPNIPEAGGMLLLPGIWLLVLLLVNLEIINPLAYAFLFVMTCFAAIGFFDDGFRLFKKEEGWIKYVANRGITLFIITVPFTYLVMPSLMEGYSVCTLYWYVVLGGLLILATSSLSNSFAGLNGWEVGSSMAVLSGLTVMAAFSEVYTSTLVVMGLIMVGAAGGLFYFNRHPARVFPGDSGTLLFGAFAGCMILFIDRWYLALGLFAPHIYDILLKLKTNPGDMSQKKEEPYVLEDGKLHVPKSGKLDFAKLIVSKLGPMTEEKLSRKILVIVANNTLFWTLLYILLKII